MSSRRLGSGTPVQYQKAAAQAIFRNDIQKKTIGCQVEILLRLAPAGWSEDLRPLTAHPRNDLPVPYPELSITFGTHHVIRFTPYVP